MSSLLKTDRPVSAILAKRYDVPYNYSWDDERNGSRGSCTYPEASYSRLWTAEEQETLDARKMPLY